MKIQLEEANRIEDVLKLQREENEKKNQKLEMEIVGLKKKFEKSKAQVMFNESLVILDEILKCQRSPFETSGLGYKKVDDKIGEVKWSPKTPEVRSTSLKEERNAPNEPAQDNKIFERSSMHQETRPVIQSKLRREVSPRWK